MLTAGIASGDTVSSAQLMASLQQTGCVKSIKQWTITTDKTIDPAESLPDVVFLDLSRDPEGYFGFGAQIRRIRPSVKLVACSSSPAPSHRSEEHTSELQSPCNLVCRLLLEKKKY